MVGEAGLAGGCIKVGLGVGGTRHRHRGQPKVLWAWLEDTVVAHGGD
jgi:hypothetical protein